VPHTQPDPVIEKLGRKTFPCWDAEHIEGIATPSLGMMVISNEVTPRQIIHETDETPSTHSNAGVGFVPRPPLTQHLPGAFAVAGPGGEGDIESVLQLDDNPELLEVSAEVVDTEEDNRKRQQQVEKEVQEKLEQKLAEQKKNTAVAEIVTGVWWSPKMRRCATLVTVLVILVFVAVVLGTVLPQALEPDPLSPQSGLNKLLSSVSLDGGAALQTPSTPQNDALRWLAGNTNFDKFSETRKIQRYVLATLFYSTNGSFWQNKTGWLSDSDECAWHNSAFARVCFEGAIVELYLNTNNLEGVLPAEIALLSNSLGEFCYV